MRKGMSYMGGGDTKNKTGVAELYFDYHYLEPKALGGTPIKNR